MVQNSDGGSEPVPVKDIAIELSVRPWRAGYAGVAKPDPGPAGGAFWLRTPSGLLACQEVDRIGDSREEGAIDEALVRLLKAAHRHRASPLLINGPEPKDERLTRLTKGLRVEFTRIPDAEAGRLALSVFPPEPVFSGERLEPVGESIYLAHGSRDYYVDVLIGTCTCPAFSYGRRPCKHLEAARRLEGAQQEALLEGGRR